MQNPDVAIQEEWLNIARNAGACKNHVAKYRAGADLFGTLTYADAMWVEDVLPELAQKCMDMLGIPLYAAVHDGYGDG